MRVDPDTAPASRAAERGTSRPAAATKRESAQVFPHGLVLVERAAGTARPALRCITHSLIKSIVLGLAVWNCEWER